MEEEQVEEEKEAEKDDAADVEPIEVGDKMKVVKGATLRETKELDSEQLGALPKGSVIEVLEGGCLLARAPDLSI